MSWVLYLNVFYLVRGGLGRGRGRGRGEEGDIKGFKMRGMVGWEAWSVGKERRGGKSGSEVERWELQC